MLSRRQVLRHAREEKEVRYVLTQIIFHNNFLLLRLGILASARCQHRKLRSVMGIRHLMRLNRGMLMYYHRKIKENPLIRQLVRLRALLLTAQSHHWYHLLIQCKHQRPKPKWSRELLARNWPQVLDLLQMVTGKYLIFISNVIFLGILHMSSDSYVGFNSWVCTASKWGNLRKRIRK